MNLIARTSCQPQKDSLILNSLRNQQKTIKVLLPVGREIVPNNYSNDGPLLVSFAMKHAYEKKTEQKCDYNDLLKKYILDEAGITSFTPWRPENGRYNPDDDVAKHIVGSPGGGYWMTTQDLAKFGAWIYDTCETDPMMKQLIIKFGQEFYPEPDRQLIAHGGSIPSSSAFFSVSLKTGAVVAIMSDQADMAFALNRRIQKNIMNDTSIDVSDDEMANSAFGQSSHTAFKKK